MQFHLSIYTMGGINDIYVCVLHIPQGFFACNKQMITTICLLSRVK